ncbi:hypothetical protein C1893_16425 [Pseudomonas sp. MPR-ANC1]|uniref:hypothetical protein n=2 Tax=unclassified Pseudomonas TaxID=196821 RepID=UPI000CD078D4|nr:hypothetical protein [Pseudomonas sp. MPR-ANC1]POA47258.1 hypothetical protein C1893_16425 [Pseudomonas sp. MPR-ANC1]
MPALKNFVAVDWRSGKDRIYFFFRDTNTYSRFNIGDNEVPSGYPRPVAGGWDTLTDMTTLRFGFTTTGIPRQDLFFDDRDILWLFSYQDGIPTVNWYNQDTDKNMGFQRVEESMWYRLLPYFDRIIGGFWWGSNPKSELFRFILNDGHCLVLNVTNGRVRRDTINHRNWPGLSRYKDRIIAVVQNDVPDPTRIYFFLTNNEYVTYSGTSVHGPYEVDERRWPGLLRD